MTDCKDETPFVYPDTASSHAKIGILADKLKNHRIAVIGIGGTGSYIVDQLAKTPISELHLWDGDDLLNHNAFRAPGAASLAELRCSPNKAHYFANIYSRMHKRVVAHGCFVNEDNFHHIAEMDFVFVSMDRRDDSPALYDKLVKQGIPFIDVGMGIQRADDSLYGVARITTVLPENQEQCLPHLPTAPVNDQDDYRTNIQIADMNALNAVLAVIRWKKLMGFYHSSQDVFQSLYSISGNHLTNETC